MDSASARPSSEYRLSQLVYFLLGALRLADHRRTRPCRVSGFEVFATDEKQENNQQHVGFHCSPMYGGVDLLNFDCPVNKSGKVAMPVLSSVYTHLIM
jgi:hypothetical protein